MQLKSPSSLRSLVGPEPGKKMSGRKLARYSDVHPSFIDHLLAGRRTSCTPATATRISEVLGVPLDLLFTPVTAISNRQTDQSKARVLVASRLRPAA